MKAEDRRTEFLTYKMANTAAERFIESIPPYGPGYNGRGIVIPGGGLRYFTCAWVCIKMLRFLGCRLPIQLWYLGEHEMDKTMIELLAPLGVQSVDASATRTVSDRPLGGWQLKAHAIVHSSFEQVLLLDADVVPIVNPENLFDWEAYIQSGAIFWPDNDRYKSDNPVWNVCGVPYRDEPRVESGQILVDKTRCWPALQLALWYNKHSDFFYRYFYGDKDSFHLAFRRLNQPYSMPYRLKRIEATNCHHDFDGNRIFQHRNHDKWNFFLENKHIDGFRYERECFDFLRELRQCWSGHIPRKRRLDPASQPPVFGEIVQRLKDRVFVYHRVGYDCRYMSLLQSGLVGRGRAACEVFWDLEENGEDIDLVLSSESKATCKLTEDKAGVWRGRWIHHEKMPVELYPVDEEVLSLADSQSINVAGRDPGIDVLITVSARDIDRLFRLSLLSCLRNFKPASNIFIVTDSKDRVLDLVRSLGQRSENIFVLDDREVLDADLYALPGWYRQQMIKLNADQIVRAPFVACLGADTIILKKIGIEDVLFEGQPILYYNRDPNWPGFLHYERGRVANVAKILRVEPLRSLPLGDFILDFNVLNRNILIKLRSFLTDMYGANPFSKIIPRGPLTPAMKHAFGEWSLYAIFILDVLNMGMPIRNSNSKFLAQVQNEAGLRTYKFDSRIVHFVRKNFDLDYITSKLGEFGITDEALLP